MLNALMKWLEDRFPVKAAAQLAARKHVPEHSRTFWYQTGSVPLTFFMIQVVTGILLMVYYAPGMETSHASVSFIMTKVKFGWLIRSIHSWSANLMILSVFIHMFSNAFNRAYRSPRELTWLTGIGMLSLLYGFGFIGYLLPWDRLAFFATTVGVNSLYAIPVVGDGLVRFMLGGDEFTSLTLTRFYTIHVMVLPIAFGGILALHLAFVQLQGDSVPESFEALPADEKKYIPFFPDFTIREMALQFFCLAVLVFLAVSLPWHLGPEASPLEPTPLGIKPEWYFYAQFAVLKMIPSKIGPIEGELAGIMIISAGIGIWALLPFWDRKGKLGVWVAFVRLILFIVMTLKGWLG